MQVNTCAIVLIGAFYNLHSVTGRHAINMRQDTPVGELWKYSCDSVATVFLMALLASLLGAQVPSAPTATVPPTLVLPDEHHTDVLLRWLCRRI